MGIVDFLLGGQEQRSVTTPRDITPPEFTALRPEVQAFLSQFLQQGGPGAEGPMVAPLTGQQTGLINTAVSGAGLSPELQAAQEQLVKTIGGNYLPGQPGQNPFIDAIVQAAQGDVQRQFEGSIVPQLLSRFTRSGQEVQGQGSSAFAHEAGLAANDLERNLGNISSTIRGGAHEAERARQAQAPGQAVALSAEGLNRLQTGLQASALPQLVQDMGIQRGLEEFNRRMNTLLEVLRITGSLTAPTPATSQVSRGESSPGLITSLFG